MRTLLLILLPLWIHAQTHEMRHGDRRFPFDNSEAFAAKPCKGLLDWSNYAESLDGKQFTLWSMFAASGVLHGMREAYHADPFCFERHYGVSPTSWAGSDAWKRNYYANNPDNGHKPEWLGNVGNDFWHTAGFLNKGFLVGGTFGIGARKKVPIKYRLFNFGLALGLQSLMASLTYKHYRT